MTSALVVPIEIVDLVDPIDPSSPVTSHFGFRQDPMGGADYSFHRGIDMVGPAGCPIHASADGVVIGSWQAHETYGKYLVIAHDDGITITSYAHMRELVVWYGDKVKKGQVIGYQGNTGISTGEHLHFEIMLDPTALFMHQATARRLDWERRHGL